MCNYRDPHWLAREYAVRSASEIAAEFGISKDAILYWLHRHGIPRRGKVTSGYLRPCTYEVSEMDVCTECGESQLVKRSGRWYCDNRECCLRGKTVQPCPPLDEVWQRAAAIRAAKPEKVPESVPVEIQEVSLREMGLTQIFLGNE